MPKSAISAREFLKRNYLTAEDLCKISEEFDAKDKRALKYVEVELKYEGYLKKQAQAIKDAQRMEEKTLPKDLDYMSIDGLRIEARQKLDEVKPLTLAQASRISGVTPADVTVLILYLRKNKL